MTPEQRKQMEFSAKKRQFLADAGVAMLVDPSFRGDGGTLFVQSASVPGPLPNFGGGGQGQGQGEGQQPGQRPAPPRRVSPWDKDAPKIPPQMVMAQEHYNRLVRMIEAGDHVKMALDLSVAFHDDDLMAYNTVAEIPGTDSKLKDEVVMLGGHMDSWHSGTGATDNGAGVAVAMEAVRILQGARPQAPPDDPDRALERRGAGSARLACLRHQAFRQVQPIEPVSAGDLARHPPGTRHPNSRSSRRISTWTTAPARSGACTCRGTRPSDRSSASGSSRSARWAPPTL